MSDTVRKGPIEYTIHDRPTSPLNLTLGVIYGAPEGDTVYRGYSCVEVEKGYFVVAGWKADRPVAIYDGDDLSAAYANLARALGMDR